MNAAHSRPGSRWGRVAFRIGAAVAIVYLLLLIPDRQKPAPRGGGQTPFAWNRDAFWSQLERRLADARSTGADRLSEETHLRLGQAGELLDQIHRDLLPPDAGVFDQLESNLFELAPLVAVCQPALTNYLSLASRIQTEIKRQSQSWPTESPAVRGRLYRGLAGTRMAVEEVLLQSTNPFPELNVVADEPSQTPAMPFRGLKLHSGDILVSRGGAPTSALIARGNDFPGGFSHVALLYVDETSGQASVIESHIECGVKVSSFDDYLKDKKLRILVLRLRCDLDAMRADPLLPHKAATAALRSAQSHHIAYDFAMDSRDSQKQFCSEVVSSAYAGCGIRLWLYPTYISSPVTSAWLASVGVRFFETQEPADLEQDPQLRLVAEWRDRNTLFKAHVDDAVIDVMLADAAPGVALPFQQAWLPAARVAKAYSAILNLFGRVGPVPEGMNATEALRVRKLRADHAAIAQRVLVLAQQFKVDKGYAPPYWELVRLAHQAKTELHRS